MVHDYGLHKNVFFIFAKSENKTKISKFSGKYAKFIFLQNFRKNFHPWNISNFLAKFVTILIFAKCRFLDNFCENLNLLGKLRKNCREKRDIFCLGTVSKITSYYCPTIYSKGHKNYFQNNNNSQLWALHSKTPHGP